MRPEAIKKIEDYFRKHSPMFGEEEFQEYMEQLWEYATIFVQLGPTAMSFNSKGEPLIVVEDQGNTDNDYENVVFNHK